MGVYKALLLAGCASTFALASPAMAQTVDCAVTPDDAACAGEEEGRIVVTGSRIQRQDFNSTTPMVTADEALLEQSSTAAIESNLNKLPQFVPAQTPTAGGDIQPTATNTPGAATISLRGIGSNRNLVLVDGRRSTPSNASGVTDINTIPAAAIERIEVISGGASATYGADAVAGVTNFILKKNFQGVELDARLGLTQEGDGFEYQFSGIMGTDFPDGRGNISLALSINTREGELPARPRLVRRTLQRIRCTAARRSSTPRRAYIASFGNPLTPATVSCAVPGGQPADHDRRGYNFQVNPDGTGVDRQRLRPARRHLQVQHRAAQRLSVEEDRRPARSGSTTPTST
jgi:outer membrane receptor protein involved in Fe transport